ncbi:hypothetical protein Dimus_030314, partial [Dionaea muscipula]
EFPACKEFYKNLTLSISKKKEVDKLGVKRVKIKLDSMILASILGVPGNNGICEYIKDVWEEFTYCKPLEITRKFIKFANNELITVAMRVKSTEIKPFQRFLHFIVMKNVAPSFGNRDTTSFMDHLLTRRLVNLPRVMLRPMTYVISIPSHELPYSDWLTRVFEAYHVPLNDKVGEEPKSYDLFEEIFLNMCQLKRENGVWWLGTGENRRRDEDENAEVNNEIAPTENVKVNQERFDWVPVKEEVNIQGKSGSDEMFYDAEVEVEGSTDIVVEVPEVNVPASAFLASPADSTTSVQKREKTIAGVDPSGPTCNIPDSEFLKLQAELDRIHAKRLQSKLDHARVENSRLQTLLQQATPQPKP